MRSNTVTFRGVSQVVRAYERNGVAPWSIWSGTSARGDMLFNFDTDDIAEGAQALREAMDLLREGGSEAAYQLRVYKRVPDSGIDSVTPYSNSFPFGLFDPAEEKTPYRQRKEGIVGAVEKVIEEKMAGMMSVWLDRMTQPEEEEPEEPAKPQGIAGVLGSLMDVPEIQKAIVGKVISWLNPSASAQVAGIGGVGDGAKVEISPDQYEKVERAVPILASCDPLIGDHLMALAKIAKEQPLKYKMAINFL